MNIRPATPADVPGVLTMVEKLVALHERMDPARFGYLPDTAERYRSWLTARTSDPRAVFLVADHERLLADVPFLAGFVIGTVEEAIPIYRVDEFGYIHDVFVAEEYRNEGLGRQMTMLAIEKFRELGVKQVRLETAAANEPARKLFASCGFRTSAIEMLVELNEPQMNADGRR